MKYNEIPISLATGSHLWLKHMGCEARSSYQFLFLHRLCVLGGTLPSPLIPSRRATIVPVGTTYPDLSMDSAPKYCTVAALIPPSTSVTLAILSQPAHQALPYLKAYGHVPSCWNILSGAQ